MGSPVPLLALPGLLNDERVWKHQAESLAMDQFATIPIYWYVSKNVVSPKITGFVDNAKDINRVRWMTKSE